jgi:hypothetical protein
LYLDLLGRPVDASGLTFWSGLLHQAVATRSEVVLGIEDSPEYRTDVIESLYQRLFGRAVDDSGLNTWGNFLERGGTAEQLEAILLGSAEYWAHRGSWNTGFVNGVYRDVLYRSPDSGGAQTWNQTLSNRTASSTVATAILACRESDGNKVQDLYHRFLHRAPEPGGYATAL